MNTERLHPEIRSAIEKLPSLPFHIKPLIPFTRLIFNAAAGSKLDKDVTSEILRNGRLTMRVFRPRSGGSDAAVIWCFGGGHIAGKSAHVNAIANHIVRETGATVFAPEYRLAPKYPFPADLDDCFAGWSYVVANAERLGININRLAVGGHSAGGGLAAALAQRILDTGGPQPVAQILFYPMLDDRTAADTSLDSFETFLWQNRTNRVAWSVYLAPHKPGAPTLHDYAAPGRRETLSGLAPAWIGYGDIDLFAGENADYAARLKAAGVMCEEVNIEGAPHAFEAVCPEAEISRSFIASAVGFLKTALNDAPDVSPSAAITELS